MLAIGRLLSLVSACIVLSLALMYYGCGSSDSVNTPTPTPTPTPKTWGTAELIEIENAGDAKDPQLAFDGSGNAIAVWYQHDGTRNNIWANRFDGSSWGTPELIETNDADNTRWPEIVFDSSGNAIAVWEQVDSLIYSIWANRFNGTSWGTAELIETDPGSSATIGSFPQIAFDGSGNAIAVWIEHDGARKNILANRFDGTSWGTAELIETDNVGNAQYPRIAFDGSGNAIAVWQQELDIFDHIWANRFDGSSWGTAELLENITTGWAYDPQIAFDGSGNAISVWEAPDGTRSNIWANRFNGTSWGTPELIETNSAGSAYDPQLAFDGSGNAIAVWKQNDGTRDNIWANRFDGTAWGTAELIETDDAGDASDPQIAFDGSGNAISVWFQNDGTRDNIWANRFNGTSWGTAELIESDNTGDAQEPQIAFDGSGNAIAVWHQTDGTRDNIWANRFE